MNLFSKFLFILPICLPHGFSQQVPPSCIPAGLYQSYQTACNQRTQDAKTVYLNTLVSLQQECIARNDFSNAIILKKALEEAKNNPLDTTAAPAWQSLADIELKTPSKWVEKISSDGKFYQKSPTRNDFHLINEHIDIEKTTPELIIFTGDLRRKWLLVEGGSIAQICHRDTRVETLTPLAGVTQASGINGKLADAQKQYRMACSRVLAPLTAKFITALEKIQKQALASGKLDDCIQIKSYIDTLKNTSPGKATASISLIKGTWKDASNILTYDISNSGELVARTKNGQIEQQGQYVRSSPAGGYFIFKITQGKEKGEERILFPYDGKIYFLKADLSNWIRVLSPNSK